MRLLVFGGWGQLGTDLFQAAVGRHDLVRPSHREVDVRDAASVTEIVATVRPDVVINAAAFHRVEDCERHPDLAFSTNSLGALNVARAAAGARSRCVFVSTDYVFDGSRREGYREDHPVAPLNVYGVSKAAGERLVKNACPNSLIVRGSGMFGHAGSSGKGGNFVETALARAEAGEPISVVDDLVFSPTSTRDMSERLIALLERNAAPGFYHLANEGTCSWYEFAIEVFRLGRVHARLSPRKSRDDTVRRPRCSVLIDAKSGAVGLSPARSWQEALEWYLDDRPGCRLRTGPGQSRE